MARSPWLPVGGLAVMGTVALLVLGLGCPRSMARLVGVIVETALLAFTLLFSVIIDRIAYRQDARYRRAPALIAAGIVVIMAGTLIITAALAHAHPYDDLGWQSKYEDRFFATAAYWAPGGCTAADPNLALQGLLLGPAATTYTDPTATRLPTGRCVEAAGGVLLDTLTGLVIPDVDQGPVMTCRKIYECTKPLPGVLLKDFSLPDPSELARTAAPSGCATMGGVGPFAPVAPVLNCTAFGAEIPDGFIVATVLQHLNAFVSAGYTWGGYNLVFANGECYTPTGLTCGKDQLWSAGTRISPAACNQQIALVFQGGILDTSPSQVRRLAGITVPASAGTAAPAALSLTAKTSADVSSLLAPNQDIPDPLPVTLTDPVTDTRVYMSRMAFDTSFAGIADGVGGASVFRLRMQGSYSDRSAILVSTPRTPLVQASLLYGAALAARAPKVAGRLWDAADPADVSLTIRRESSGAVDSLGRFTVVPSIEEAVLGSSPAAILYAFELPLQEGLDVSAAQVASFVGDEGQQAALAELRQYLAVASTVAPAPSEYSAAVDALGYGVVAGACAGPRDTLRVALTESGLWEFVLLPFPALNWLGPTCPATAPGIEVLPHPLHRLSRSPPLLRIISRPGAPDDIMAAAIQVSRLGPALISPDWPRNSTLLTAYTAASAGGTKGALLSYQSYPWPLAPSQVAANCDTNGDILVSFAVTAVITFSTTRQVLLDATVWDNPLTSDIRPSSRTLASKKGISVTLAQGASLTPAPLRITKSTLPTGTTTTIDLWVRLVSYFSDAPTTTRTGSYGSAVDKDGTVYHGAVLVGAFDTSKCK